MTKVRMGGERNGRIPIYRGYARVESESSDGSKRDADRMSESSRDLPGQGLQSRRY
jgi:hypothetical protein